MFYQEKWINGELYYKNTPKGKWYKYTKEQYIRRLINKEEEILLLKDKLKQLQGDEELEIK